jgi:glycosyltransferase involved in cell wall biosynthesis
MKSPAESLWIVMPVYNEEESIRKVLNEWFPVVRSLDVPFVFAVINDGSKDQTLKILQDEAQQNSEMQVYDRTNSGHGRSCIFGYQEALRAGADWVLQIDSDGQCDPKYLPRFWQARKNHSVLMGFRYYRKDGLIRFLVSRFVTLVVFFASGVWVWDPNVPYRLISADTLSQSLQTMPDNFHLANVLIAARLKRLKKIKWLPIVFRERYGGSPSVRTHSFLKQGAVLFKQLRREQTERKLC